MTVGLEGETMPKRKKPDYASLIDACDTGDSMIENRTRHIKLQGFSGSGKSTFALSFFAHHSKGLKPEECLLTIVDCDMEGQADLVAREDIIPAALRPRILRKVCQTPDEVNDYVLAFIDLHRQHQEEHPNGVRVMVMENEGAYYMSVRNHYAESVHGLSEGDLLLSRQRQALSEGKKTLPTYEEGQMHAYKVINRLFIQPYERLKMGAELYGAHFISTTLLKSRTEGFGTANAKDVVVAAGRPEITDPLFDWIIEFTQQQRVRKGELKSRHLAQVRKSRACSPFAIDNPTQERFWLAVDKQSGAE